MKAELTYNQVASWSEKIQAQGRYSFALTEMKQANPELSNDAVKFALKRLSDKGRVLSVFKGYYLIIPPKYASKGILPPALYLDAFMKHLQRPYYVGLLNAAVFHGASHQQPQEYFVFTNFPVLRPTVKKGLKINYISIKEIPEPLLVKKKTEAGYLSVSNAALTACDLIQFEKRVGGLNRAATVINELAEDLTPNNFTTELLKQTPITALQRLGYILQDICFNNGLADGLFNLLMNNQAKFYRIPLKAAKETKGFSSYNRWKVIVNTEIEIDD